MERGGVTRELFLPTASISSYHPIAAIAHSAAPDTDTLAGVLPISIDSTSKSTPSPLAQRTLSASFQTFSGQLHGCDRHQSALSL